MAKRAKMFEPQHPVDYKVLTEQTFDWRLWIEQETQRRYETSFAVHGS